MSLLGPLSLGGWGCGDVEVVSESRARRRGLCVFNLFGKGACVGTQENKMRKKGKLLQGWAWPSFKALRNESEDCLPGRMKGGPRY